MEHYRSSTHSIPGAESEIGDEEKVDQLVGFLRFDKIALDCVIPYLEKLSDEQLKNLAVQRGIDKPLPRDERIFAVAKACMIMWDNELPEGTSDNDEIAKYIIGGPKEKGSKECQG